LLGFDYSYVPNGPYALFSNNGNYMPGGFLEHPPAESSTTWMHTAAVFDASTVLLYVDGTLAAQQAAGFSTLYDSTENVIIGAVDNGANLNFDGIVDEVRISSSPRSGDWIAAQYLSMTDSLIDYFPIEAY
jgi:hypothetical protein